MATHPPNHSTPPFLLNAIPPTRLRYLYPFLFQIAFVRYRLILRTTPSHVSIPPNQKGTLAKDGFSVLESYNLGNDAAWWRARLVGTHGSVCFHKAT